MAEWIVSQLEQTGYRVFYQHKDIRPGDVWPPQLDNALSESGRVLAVLSPAYLRSPFCALEWVAARKRSLEGASRALIPVRVVDFEPNLIFQQIGWIDLVGLEGDQKSARLLAEVARAIGGNAARKLPVLDISELRRDVPVISGRFVARPDLSGQIRGLVLAPGASTVGLVGIGGAGKSMIARAVISDEAVQAHFANRVAWLKIGPAGDPATAQAQLASALGDNQPIADAASGLIRLRGLLKGLPHLIVLDDVWDRRVLEAFDLGAPTVLLVTTRNADVLDRAADACQIGLLDPQLARRVLATWACTDAESLPAEAGSVVDDCGGLALALAAAGGLVADGWSWPAVHERLHEVDLARLRTDFPDYPHPDLLAAFDVSVTALPHRLGERYLELAVFTAKGPVPVKIAWHLWRAAGLDEVDTEQALVDLARRSLVQIDPVTRTFTLHDLQFDYLRKTLGDDRIKGMHGILAAAITDHWGGLGHSLPATAHPGFGDDPADGYALEHLVQHMAAAGRGKSIHDLLAATGDRGNLWFELHERAGNTATYLHDLAVARGLAEAATDRAVAQGSPAVTVALEIRYALTLGSVASLADNIPSYLLTALAESGIWPYRQAVAYARALPEPHDKLDALTGLIPLLPQELRPPIATEALVAARATKSAIVQVHALDRLSAHLSESQQERFVADILDDARRSGPLNQANNLLQVAEAVPLEQRRQVVAEALSAARNEWRATGVEEAEALTALAQLSTGKEQARLLAQAVATANRIQGTLQRHVLIDIASQLRGQRRRKLLRRALSLTRQITQPSGRCDGLIDVAKLMPARAQGRLFAEAFAAAKAADNRSAFWAVTSIADLPDPYPAGALGIARAIPDPDHRSFALRLLADRLSPAGREEALMEALTAARDITAPSGRAKELAAVALDLPADRRNPLLIEALSAARALNDRASLAPTFASLAACVPEPRRSEVFDLAMRDARAGHQLHVLCEVAAYLPPPRSAELLADALTMVEQADNPPEIAFRLEELMSQLPARMVRRAVAALQRIDAALPRTTGVAWAALADRLPEHLIVEAVERVLAYRGRVDREIDAFVRLAPCLPEELILEIFDAIGARYNEHGQAPIKAVLAPFLPEWRRGPLVRELLGFAAHIAGPFDDAEPRCRLLRLLAPAVPDSERATVLADAVANARRIRTARDRAAALTELAKLMPPKAEYGVLAEALATATHCDDIWGAVFAMGEVAKTASELGLPAWGPFWRPTLAMAARIGRHAVAEQVAAAAVRDIGNAAGDSLSALEDIVRWWP